MTESPSLSSPIKEAHYFEYKSDCYIRLSPDVWYYKDCDANYVLDSDYLEVEKAYQKAKEEQRILDKKFVDDCIAEEKEKSKSLGGYKIDSAALGLSLLLEKLKQGTKVSDLDPDTLWELRQIINAQV